MKRILRISKYLLFAVISIGIAISLYVLAFFSLAPEAPGLPEVTLTDRTYTAAADFRHIPLFGNNPENEKGPLTATHRDDFLESPTIIKSVTVKLTGNEQDSHSGPAEDLYLSGEAENLVGWNLDGFLLVESFGVSGFYSSCVIGDIDGLTDSNSGMITRIGRKTSQFLKEEVNLAAIVAPDEESYLRIQLLSLGDGGSTSDLFLVRVPR